MFLIILTHVFLFVYMELQVQKAQNQSPIFEEKKEQEGVSFCDQLPSNTVVLNHKTAEHTG